VASFDRSPTAAPQAAQQQSRRAVPSKQDTSMRAPSSPAAKSKKQALPSYLSNIRNAQASIDRELKPFLSPAISAADRKTTKPQAPILAGGLSSSASGRSTINRNPSRWATSIQNFGQRFGDQWRKRRRKKGSGNVSVPQAFYVSVACFFFAFPLFFVLFILARHAVFGDESLTVTSRHEVPAHPSDAAMVADPSLIMVEDPSPIEAIEDLVGLNDNDERKDADESHPSNVPIDNEYPNVKQFTADATNNEETDLPKQTNATIAETSAIVSSETVKVAGGAPNATDTVETSKTQVMSNATIQLDEMKAQILSEQKKMAFGMEEVAAGVSSSSSKLDEKDQTDEPSIVNPSKVDTETKSRMRSNDSSTGEADDGKQRRTLIRGSGVR